MGGVPPGPAVSVAPGTPVLDTIFPLGIPQTGDGIRHLLPAGGMDTIPFRSPAATGKTRRGPSASAIPPYDPQDHPGNPGFGPRPGPRPLPSPPAFRIRRRRSNRLPRWARSPAFQRPRRSVSFAGRPLAPPLRQAVRCCPSAAGRPRGMKPEVRHRASSLCGPRPRGGSLVLRGPSRDLNRSPSSCGTSATGACRPNRMPEVGGRASESFSSFPGIPNRARLLPEYAVRFKQEREGGGYGPSPPSRGSQAAPTGSQPARVCPSPSSWETICGFGRLMPMSMYENYNFYWK